MANVDIVIRTIDQSKGGVTGLTSNLKSLVAQYASVGAVAGAAYKVIHDSIKVTQDYAREVRDLSKVSGTTAEQASRLLQVLDDFEITAQDVTAATRFMTKAGLTPTIETLAKLSDEYLAINDAQERNEFILKNLGRSGLQWVNVLNQGGDALKQMSDEVNSNLILTDKQIQATEEYRLNVDQLNDSIMGLKVSVGGDLINDLNAMFWQFEHVNEIWAELIKNGDPLGDLFLRNGQAIAEQNVKVREYTGGLDSAGVSYRAWAQAMEQSKPVIDTATVDAEELEKQIQAISEKNELFIDTLSTVGGALKEYQEGVAAADAELAAGDIKIDEHKTKLDELAAKYDETKNRVILSIVEMKLATDGWTDKELTAYLKVGEQLGVFTEDQRKATVEVLGEVDKLISGVQDLDQPMYHVGMRARDAGKDFGIMADGARGLGETIRKDATPAVAGLKSQINGLPPSGSSWRYDFEINVSGQVPKMATASWSTAAGYNTDVHPGGGGAWRGGPLNGGWTVVGDAPGGSFGPYTEAIYNGMVFDAATTRKLRDAGILGDAKHRMYGGEIESPHVINGPPPPPAPFTPPPHTTVPGRANSPSEGGGGEYYAPAGGGGGAAVELATLATTVADQAVGTSQLAIAAQRSTQDNMQMQTNQTVQAQAQAADNISSEIRELQRLIRKQPTTADMYSLWHSGQQTSI